MDEYFGCPALKIPVYNLTLDQLREYLNPGGPHISFDDLRGLHHDAAMRIAAYEEDYQGIDDAERMAEGYFEQMRSFRRVERLARKALQVVALYGEGR